MLMSEVQIAPFGCHYSVFDLISQMRMSLLSHRQCVEHIWRHFQPVMEGLEIESYFVVGETVLNEFIFADLDKNHDKFNLLIFMLQKLFSFVDQTSLADSPDALQNQEVLQAGQLIAAYLKEKLQEWLYRTEKLLTEEINNKKSFDLGENILVPLDNYISRGTAPIMADTNLEDGDIEPAPKLVEVLFQNWKGQVDHWVEPYLWITAEWLRRAEKPYIKCLLLEVVANALYYNASLSLSILHKLGVAADVFNLWFQMLMQVRKSGMKANFKREHDKKVCCLGSTSLLALPAVQLPEDALGRVFRAMLELLISYKYQVSEAAKEDEAEDGDDMDGFQTDDNDDDGVEDGSDMYMGVDEDGDEADGAKLQKLTAQDLKSFVTGPLSKLLPLGLGLLYLGKQESVKAIAEFSKTLNEKIRKLCDMTLLSCAYAGTGNVLKVNVMDSLSRLSHDLDSEVAMAANIGLGLNSCHSDRFHLSPYLPGKLYDVAEAYSSDDTVKGYAITTIMKTCAELDSARQTLDAMPVNAFVNAGFGQDILMTVPSEASGGSASGNWLFKNKEHGKTSAAASLGMIFNGKIRKHWLLGLLAFLPSCQATLSPSTQDYVVNHPFLFYGVITLLIATLGFLAIFFRVCFTRGCTHYSNSCFPNSDEMLDRAEAGRAAAALVVRAPAAAVVPAAAAPCFPCCRKSGYKVGTAVVRLNPGTGGTGTSSDLIICPGGTASFSGTTLNVRVGLAPLTSSGPAQATNTLTMSVGLAPPRWGKTASASSMDLKIQEVPPAQPAPVVRAAPAAGTWAFTCFLCKELNINVDSAVVRLNAGTGTGPSSDLTICTGGTVSVSGTALDVSVGLTPLTSSGPSQPLATNTFKMSVSFTWSKIEDAPVELSIEDAP